ncbi:MAG: hypothetical protein FD129_3305, partial [bacterium]
PAAATCSTRLTSATATFIAAMVDSADSIVTYRVDPEDLPPPAGEPGSVRKVGGYRIISSGRTASETDRKAIRDTFLDPDAHHRHPNKCEFSPGVGIELVRPETSGFILICFSCSQFSIGDDRGRKVAFGDFGLARGEFVELVQRLLPDDAELKTLKTTTRTPPGH